MMHDLAVAPLNNLNSLRGGMIQIPLGGTNARAHLYTYVMRSSLHHAIAFSYNPYTP